MTRTKRLGIRSSVAMLFGTLGLLPSSPAFAASDQVMEEVIVTGSLIRRGDSFDTATPVKVMSRADLEGLGDNNLGEIMQDQSFQFGVDATANILGATPSTGSFSQANIRGLGTSATLTLLNGRRTPNQNVQNLYPSIMLDRIETLTDGAAVTYGTDAVAGVVNLIPRTRYEGIEFNFKRNDADDWHENKASFISGGGNDRTHVVVGLEYRNRDRLKMVDRPTFARSAVGSSGDSPVGDFNMPVRSADGSILRDDNGNPIARNIPDPGCGVAVPGDVRDRGSPENFITGFRSPFDAAPQLGDPGECRREFNDEHDFLGENETFMGLATLTHEFNDYIRFSGEFLFGREEADTRGSQSNPGGQLARLPTIPGTHPGNPFRAMTVDGTPLFAQDANGDGVPDRGNADVNGDGLNDVIVTGTDPSSGIPFNEDVRIAAWRPLGRITRANPEDAVLSEGNLGEFATRSRSDGSGLGDFTFQQDNFRWAGRVDIDIPDTTWGFYVDFTYHQTEFSQPEPVESLSAIQAGLVGEADLPFTGDNPGDSLRYFNPFSTQLLHCENRQCEFTGTPDQPNSIEVLDSFAVTERLNIETTIANWETVGSGQLFELPAGPVQLAVGYQRRFFEVEQDSGPISNSRDAFILIEAQDFDQERDTNDIFGEIEIPVFDNATLGNLSINGATRQTFGDDNSAADLDDIIGKVSLRWEPRPFLAIRASVGEAFIAPSLTELFEPESFELSNVSDPLFQGGSTFKARGVGGNPNLNPETSDQLNVGFTARLLDGDLTLTSDFHIFDFSDRIDRPIPQDIVEDDFARFLGNCQPANPEDRSSQCQAGAFQGLTVDAAARQFALNNDNIDNNPNNFGESNLVFRDPDTLAVQRFSTPLLNLAGQKWIGLDFGLNYRFDAAAVLPWVDRNIGRLEVDWNATWTSDFETEPEEGAPVFDGAGKRNDETAFVPPIPEIRGTGRVSWTYGRHALSAIVHYQSSVTEDDNLCRDISGAGLPANSPINQFVRTAIGAIATCKDEIEPPTIVDFQYDLSLDGLVVGDRSTHFRVGVLNAFDEFTAPSATLGGIEVFLQDPRGRQVYAEIRQEL